ncbi:MAG: Ig-like domain-containing protein [Bermanella sp.]
MIITYPAKDSVVSDSMVEVRADIPESAQAQEVRLLVDGIEIAKDSDGAPWEIQWPAHLFADGGKHTLLLKTITGEGNEVRNNEQFQLTVSEQANKALTFEEGFDGRSIQDQGSLTFTFAEIEGATGYEILVDGELITTDSAELELNNLDVGTHTVQYRVLHDGVDATPFSEEVSFEVLPAALPAINDAVIDGISVTLSWDAITDGDNYAIYWGGEDSSLELLDNINTNSYTVTEAGTGSFEWAIRRTNFLGQQSVVSNKAAVELLAPSLPVLNDPVVEHKEDGYQATLSWKAMADGDSYTVYFGKTSDGQLQAQTATTASSIVMSGLELGSYQWYLKRTNKFSQSVTGEFKALSVGVFRVQLGGNDNDYGRQIIASKDGGSIVLANTASKGDSQGDDWFIKLDSNGNVEWEFVLNKSGFTRLTDLREFSDGSIYAMGATDQEKGYVVKLSGESSPENRLIWEAEYRSLEAETAYFYSLSELNEKLYIVGRECISINCQLDSYYNLYEFDATSGSYISVTPIPHPTGAHLSGIGYLSTTRNDDFLLACSADPEIAGKYNEFAGCMVNFNESGELNWSWQSLGSEMFLNGRFATETPWGGFVLAGQSGWGSLAVAIFNYNGDIQGSYTSSDGYSNQRDTITFDDDNNILRLISGDDSDLPELLSTSQYGSTEVIKVFGELERVYASPASLAKSKDGGLLTLFSEGQDGYDNRDLIIMKTDMQGNM